MFSFTYMIYDTLCNRVLNYETFLRWLHSSWLESGHLFCQVGLRPIFRKFEFRYATFEPGPLLTKRSVYSYRKNRKCDEQSLVSFPISLEKRTSITITWTIQNSGFKIPSPSTTHPEKPYNHANYSNFRGPFIPSGVQNIYRYLVRDQARDLDAYVSLCHENRRTQLAGKSSMRFH